MRRDICQFYPKGVQEVFDAYVAAARDRFDKECDAKPYYSISFGLNFSFKYNMNGGACTVHFMPCNGGTAVNVRYSIAQGVGARYGAHNRDLTKVVESRLGCSAQEANIDVEEFLKPEHQVIAQSAPAPLPVAEPQPTVQYAAQPQQAAYSPQPQPQPAEPVAQACRECGAPLKPNAKFCAFCGKPVAVEPPKCSNCGETVGATDKFCANCGNKLK